jgi:hypothetical protein
MAFQKNITFYLSKNTRAIGSTHMVKLEFIPFIISIKPLFQTHRIVSYSFYRLHLIICHVPTELILYVFGSQWTKVHGYHMFRPSGYGFTKKMNLSMQKSNFTMN